MPPVARPQHDVGDLRAAGILIFRREPGQAPEFLLVQSNDGDKGWTPPKGHLLPGESDLDGARRETQEETALQELTGYTFFNNSTAPIFSTSYWDGKRRRNKTSVYFLAQLVPGAHINMQVAELADFVWLPAVPAKHRMIYPEMGHLIDAAMAILA
jgi:8-oxo-dGTP pyrophosphatase MutT (NUDIX family)